MKETQYIKVDKDGNKSYYKDKDLTLLHRIDGPAIEWKDGGKEWWVNGFLHRTDGPAIESAFGDKYWFVNGKHHRTDGPAVECPDGYKAWHINDKRHRTDGPAIIRHDGTKEWWVNGVRLTEEKFNRKKQPTVNINGKDFTIEELNALIDTEKGK